MAPEDEGRDLDQKIDQITDATLDTTRRMRGLAEETNQIGVDTLVKLNEQGEQLDNIERNMDGINADLKMADVHLTELEKCCCGLCTCKCRAPKKIEKSRRYQKAFGIEAQKEQQQHMDGVVSEEPECADKRKKKKAAGPLIKRITDDDREDEMEENLQAVSDVLGKLKGIGTEMGNELDRQNQQLDRINRKGDVNIAHLDQATGRTRQLIKRL